MAQNDNSKNVKIQFALYMNSLTEYISTDESFNLSVSVRDNWQRDLKLDDATCTKLMEFSYRFIKKIPEKIVYNPGFIEMFVAKLAGYLAPYFVRAYAGKSVDDMYKAVYKEFFRNSTFIKKIQKTQAIWISGARRAQNIAKQVEEDEAAKSAATETKRVRKRITHHMGKVYKHVDTK